MALDLFSRLSNFIICFFHRIGCCFRPRSTMYSKMGKDKESVPLQKNFSFKSKDIFPGVIEGADYESELRF